MRSFSATKGLTAPLEQYLAQLQKERGISSSSLSNYRSDLALFRDFIADYRIAQWADVTNVQAQAFIEETKIRQLSAATAKRRLSSLQGFFNYLRRSAVITRDPLLGFKVKPVTSSTEPATIEIDKDLLQRFVADGFISRRDKAIVELLLCCELSLAELLTLELFSIDFSQNSIQLHREHEGDVSLPLTATAFASIKAWLELRMALVTFEQSLFISEKGQRISIRTLQLGIARIGKAQGVTPLTAKAIAHVRRKAVAPQSESLAPALNMNSAHLSQLLETYKKIKPRG